MNVIESIVKDFIILVDTSSFMSEGALDFFHGKLRPVLESYNKKVIIPLVVIKELENNRNKQNIKTSKMATQGYKIVKYLLDNNLAEVRGESSDKFPDQVFRRIYSQYGTSRNLAFITNDNKLSKEICQLRNSESIKTRFKLKIISVREDGNIIITCNDGDFVYNKHKKKIASTDMNSSDLSEISNQKLFLSVIPKENDYVKTYSGLEIKLMKEIASGGEGKIFLTNMNDKMLVKVYTKESLSGEIKYKIEQMSQINIKSRKNKFKIAWPIEPVVNEKEEFCGFLMERLEGKTLHEVCFTPAYAKKLNLKRLDLVNISINLIEAFLYLHYKNIIIGDINPRNILVDINNGFSIGMIDTDSYQFKNFSCKVGTLEFTRPTLLRKGVNYNLYRRQPSDDLFSVAVVIFRILMLGKHPYSYAGGEDVVENMKNGKFPYRVGDKEYEDTPIGPWKFIWSHIPRRLKESLGRVLLDDVSIDRMDELIKYEREIKKHLEEYRALIESGKFTNELMPRSFNVPDKINGQEINRVFVKCSKCGYEFFMAKDYYDYIRLKNRDVLCGICLQTAMFNKNNAMFNKNNENVYNRNFSPQGNNQHSNNDSGNWLLNFFKKIFS